MRMAYVCDQDKMRKRRGLNEYGMSIGRIGHDWNVYVRREEEE